MNSFGEYWQGNEFPPVFPFTEADADGIEEFGWNAVRLLFTWSRVEPGPGVDDVVYFDELEAAVRTLEERGIYTVLDAHQDAWGPTLAARPDEVCDEGSVPANGWDGAPGWATLVDDATPRCAAGATRELSPAVCEAVGAFFANAEGPGGVGIRDRYVAMWGHIAERFAGDSAIAGYDIVNEPNAFTDEELAGLGELYSDALVAIRSAENAAGAESHMVLFEPWALWSSTGEGPLVQWDHDSNVVYSPHIYPGSFTGDPLTNEWFDNALADAAQYGGAPILTGERGAAIGNHRGTQRVGPDGANYFIEHQAFQDELHLSATLWHRSESCGDPHNVPLTDTPRIAGPVDMDCTTNTPGALRVELIDDLTRPYPRAAPGRMSSIVYDEEAGTLDVAADDASLDTEVVVFYPTGKHPDPEATGTGLADIAMRPGPGESIFVTGTTTAPEWSLTVG